MDNSIYPSVFRQFWRILMKDCPSQMDNTSSSVKMVNLTIETLRANDADSNENVKKQWVL